MTDQNDDHQSCGGTRSQENKKSTPSPAPQDGASHPSVAQRMSRSRVTTPQNSFRPNPQDHGERQTTSSRRVSRQRQSPRTQTEKARNIQKGNKNGFEYHPLIPKSPPECGTLTLECPLCYTPSSVFCVFSCGHIFSCVACGLIALTRNTAPLCTVCSRAPTRVLMIPATMLSRLCPDGDILAAHSVFDVAVTQPDMKPMKGLGQLYGTPPQLEYASALMRFNCPICKKEFDSATAWSLHLDVVHHLKSCEQCTRCRQQLPCQMLAYPQTLLAKHAKSGVRGVDPPSFHGHPLCVLCDTYQYDDVALEQHLVEQHLRCELCAENGYTQEWFTDADALRSHTLAEHHICPLCRDEDKIIAFASRASLAAHTVAEHGSQLARRELMIARHEASHVDLDESAFAQFSQADTQIRAPEMTSVRARLAERVRSQLPEDDEGAHAAPVEFPRELPTLQEVYGSSASQHPTPLQSADRVLQICGSTTLAESDLNSAIEKAEYITCPSFAQDEERRRRKDERQRRFILGDAPYAVELLISLQLEHMRDSLRTQAQKQLLLDLLSRLIKDPQDYPNILSGHLDLDAQVLRHLVALGSIMNRLAPQRDSMMRKLEEERTDTSRPMPQLSVLAHNTYNSPPQYSNEIDVVRKVKPRKSKRARVVQLPAPPPVAEPQEPVQIGAVPVPPDLEWGALQEIDVDDFVVVRRRPRRHNS